MNYEVEGSGSPAIVLLHGVGGKLHNFDALASELSKSLTVLRFDMRGFGKSDKPVDKPYSLDVWADDLLELMDALKIGEAVVIGHSMGDRIACRFAAKHPTRISGLVALNTTGWGSNPDGAASLKEALDRAETLGMRTFLQNAPWLQRLQLRLPGIAELEEKETLENDLRAYGLAIRTIISDFTGKAGSSFLKEIHCPALVIVGDRDSAPPFGGVGAAATDKEFVTGSHPGLRSFLIL